MRKQVAELQRRITELEALVRELQARPPIVINNPAPVYPAPQLPAYEPRWGEITCASVTDHPIARYEVTEPRWAILGNPEMLVRVSNA